MAALNLPAGLGELKALRGGVISLQWRERLLQPWILRFLAQSRVARPGLEVPPGVGSLGHEEVRVRLSSGRRIGFQLRGVAPSLLELLSFLWVAASRHFSNGCLERPGSGHHVRLVDGVLVALGRSFTLPGVDSVEDFLEHLDLVRIYVVSVSFPWQRRVWSALVLG